MNLLEAAAMTLVTMLLLLLCGLFACLGYAVWTLAIPVWERALLEVLVVLFGTFTLFVMAALAAEAFSS